MRREITVGLAEDVLRYGESFNTRPRRTGYTGGPRDDSGPLMALMWSDIRRSYRRNRISDHCASMFEFWLEGVSLSRIAQWYGVTKSAAQQAVERVRKALETDPKLGIFTTIFEECGGWTALRECMFDS